MEKGTSSLWYFPPKLINPVNHEKTSNSNCRMFYSTKLPTSTLQKHHVQRQTQNGGRIEDIMIKCSLLSGILGQKKDI